MSTTRCAQWPQSWITEAASARFIRTHWQNGYLDAEFEYIGSGAKYGSLEGAIIIEELSRGLASLGLIVSPHYQCTELIACCGTETLKKKVIEPARRGELLFAFAISEERGGSDALGVDTIAVKDAAAGY